MEHSSQEFYEMHAIVRGKVQGVGFRAMTRHHATSLGITGTVRNLADGTVEIYAHGTKEKLNELIDRLKEEIGPGEILDTAMEYFPVDTLHKDFRIIVDE